VPAVGDHRGSTLRVGQVCLVGFAILGTDESGTRPSAGTTQVGEGKSIIHTGIPHKDQSPENSLWRLQRPRLLEEMGHHAGVIRFALARNRAWRDVQR